ncbi:hypothetical protein IH824_20740, partial [candidate division KSB1 bacterium]|nr:hypothetical protein [candidate division KSB1 bacterium]
KPVQEDSAQSTVFSDTSSASLTQTSNGSQEDDAKWTLNKSMPWLVALTALLFGIYQYRKRVQDTAKIEKAKLKAKDDFDKEKKLQKPKPPNNTTATPSRKSSAALKYWARRISRVCR